MDGKAYPFASDTELRVRCAEIVASYSDTHGDVPGRAQRLYDFVTGVSDKTPAEKLRDALSECGVTLPA